MERYIWSWSRKGWKYLKTALILPKKSMDQLSNKILSCIEKKTFIFANPWL